MCLDTYLYISIRRREWGTISCVRSVVCFSLFVSSSQSLQWPLESCRNYQETNFIIMYLSLIIVCVVCDSVSLMFHHKILLWSFWLLLYGDSQSLENMALYCLHHHSLLRYHLKRTLKLHYKYGSLRRGKVSKGSYVELFEGVFNFISYSTLSSFLPFICQSCWIPAIYFSHKGTQVNEFTKSQTRFAMIWWTLKFKLLKLDNASAWTLCGKNDSFSNFLRYIPIIPICLVGYTFC